MGTAERAPPAQPPQQALFGARVKLAFVVFMYLGWFRTSKSLGAVGAAHRTSAVLARRRPPARHCRLPRRRRLSRRLLLPNLPSEPDPSVTLRRSLNSSVSLLGTSLKLPATALRSSSESSFVPCGLQPQLGVEPPEQERVGGRLPLPPAPHLLPHGCHVCGVDAVGAT